MKKDKKFFLRIARAGIICCFLLSFSCSKNFQIESFQFENNNVKVRLTNYGATIQELWVKDKNGAFKNIVLGFKDPERYMDNTMYLGSCIGRYAGRLSPNTMVDGKIYALSEKNGIHLHGGDEGFNKKLWTVIELKNNAITFEYLSKEQEEGYPGNLTVRAKYSLEEKGLKVEYTATTDATTVVNLTNHSHFNLSPKKSLNGQYVQIASDSILEISSDLLPTGSFLSVDNGQYDFRKIKGIDTVRFDTTFMLGDEKPQIKYFAPDTGIHMNISTNQPGVVIYTSNKVNTICFETQNFPDAPNHKNFPSALLRPGEKYMSSTYWEFETKMAIEEK